MPRAPARFTITTKSARLSLGPPILPHGVEWSVDVPAGKLPEATKALLKLWASVEGSLPKLPVPGPDMIPGGNAVDDPGDDFWEGMQDTPPRIGFMAPEP